MKTGVQVNTLVERTFSVLGATPLASLAYVLGIGGLAAVGGAMGVVDTDNLRFGPFSVFPGNDDTSSGGTDVVMTVATFTASWLLLRAQLSATTGVPAGKVSLWSFLGLSILAILGVIFGLILFIAPGIVLLVRWSAANGYAVGRGLGPITALKASWEATEGHGWPIFFAGLIVTVGTTIALGIIVTAMMKIDQTTGIVVGQLLEALANVISFAFSVAVYGQVADTRGEVAEVFA